MVRGGANDGDGRGGPAPDQLPLPSNLEVEQALLGAILVNNEALTHVAGFLRPEHFYEPLHGAIYQVAGEMVAARKPVTPGTIRTFLPADLMVGNDLTIAQYLARLAAEATTIINAHDFGRMILDLSHRRDLVGIGMDLMSDAKLTDRRVNISPVVEAASSRLFEIATDLAELRGTETAVEADYHDVVAAAKARLETGAHAVAGISTGILSLDNKVPGLLPGDFVLLAGRPSMGKSVLGLNIAGGAARRGEAVLFDSLELTGGQVRSRLLSDYLERQGQRVTYKDIDRGRIRPDDVGALERAADALDAYPLIVSDRGNRLDEIPAKIREARRRLERVGKELKLYVLDYLGLVKPTDRYRGDRVREVGEMSGTMKALAKQEGLPFLVLHQLNRANEARKDRRPTLADLRDAGNLEQDADVVMFVYREAYYHDRPGYTDESESDRLAAAVDHANDMEIIVAKQRQGPVGTVKAWCDVSLNAVRDLAYQAQSWGGR